MDPVKYVTRYEVLDGTVHVFRDKAEAESWAQKCGTCATEIEIEDPEAKAARMARERAKLTCPSCKRAYALTSYEVRHGYQCRDCTARDEGMGY